MTAADDILNDLGLDDDGRPPPDPRTLPEVHRVFARWFGGRFDWQYLNTTLAAAADGLHGTGDPAWLQVVGGPGAAKTEVLAATERAGCTVVSTLSGEAALLSATPRKDIAKDATGGLLRVVGDRGVLVIKDFTSILSMHREARGEVLGALREIYDGAWHRDVGVDGGKRLTWRGRCTILSGVTGTYDDHYSVIASMGDRFMLIRLDSENPEVRLHARRQAIRNTGGEDEMRRDLADAAAGFLLHIDPARGDLGLDDALVDEVGDLADLITLARSEVSRDIKGDPQYAHAAEMPTRVAKQLVVMYRAAHMIGLDHDDAIRIVRRIAHDTIPPPRRKVLLAVHDHPGEASKTIAEKVGMARSSADRVLRELALHKLIRHEEEEFMDANGRVRERWRWYATTAVDLAVLREGFGTAGEHVPEMSGGGTGDA